MLDVTLSKKVAYQILSHFDKSYRWFTRITRGAQSRFEQGQWKEIQLASKERITIYEQSLSQSRNFTYCAVSLKRKQLDSKKASCESGSGTSGMGTSSHPFLRPMTEESKDDAPKDHRLRGDIRPSLGTVEQIEIQDDDEGGGGWWWGSHIP